MRANLLVQNYKCLHWNYELAQSVCLQITRRWLNKSCLHAAIYTPHAYSSRVSGKNTCLVILTGVFYFTAKVKRTAVCFHVIEKYQSTCNVIVRIKIRRLYYKAAPITPVRVRVGIKPRTINHRMGKKKWQERLTPYDFLEPYYL